MILVGIDDTDMPDTRGTNHLARQLAATIGDRYRCLRIVRHQLCGDPEIPCTSKNGSASLALEPRGVHNFHWLRTTLRDVMLREFIPGSDPGLCIAESVADGICEFGQLAQRETTTQSVARKIAAEAGVHLEGLGGTEGGVIGALAAVGLAVGVNDGRVIQFGDWPDDLQGVVDVSAVTSRGVVVRTLRDQRLVETGRVDLIKRLRPNLRQGRMVLTVEPSAGAAEWVSVRML